jgi:hypothetical protein
MFEKLLATLPYNPGLADQMVFYGRRMREESAIRRTGLIFIVLAFMIQFFAVLNPPRPAAAAACSGNDLVYCGISGPQEAAVETTATSLPNTGPGTSLFIGGVIVVGAGYFYGRSRLLAKESTLALKESTAAGAV